MNRWALTKLLLLHTVRHWGKHRTMTALNIVGIALGVAVFVAISVANQSALHAFAASLDLVAGKANLEVVGDSARFDETLLKELWKESEVVAATPCVEEVVTLPGHAGKYLHILGVDVFSNNPLRTWQIERLSSHDAQKNAASTERELASFFTERDTVALTEKMAQSLGIQAGQSLQVRTTRGRELSLRAVYLVRPSADAVGVDDTLALMDIANAQELFDAVGKLDRIDALVASGTDEAALQKRLQDRMPAHVDVRRPDRRNQQIETMLGAFQLNLTALSLIALAVGVFLVFNTLSAAVVRRRGEIGLLRALGLQKREVRLLFLGEAALLGAVGSALGIFLGVLLATFISGAVSQTISSLYILVSISQLQLPPGLLILSFFFGIGTVCAAAWYPAEEAAAVQPVEALTGGAGGKVGTLSPSAQRRLVKAGLAASVLFILLAVLLSAGCREGLLPSWMSFGAALTVMLSFAALAPAGVTLLSRTLLAMLPEGNRLALPRLALRQFQSALHRHAVTVAAVTAALAMALGVSIMIHSFRETVSTWLSRSVKADLFIASASTRVTGRGELLPPHVREVLESCPEVDMIDSYRETRLTVHGKKVRLACVDFNALSTRGNLLFSQPSGTRSDTLILVAKSAGDVLVTEAFYRNLGLGAGQSFELNAPSGAKSLRIAGVFTDYTTSEGLILIDRALFQQLWGEAGEQSLAAYLKPGADLPALKARLQSELSDNGALLIHSNYDLREEVFRIFDQTFAVTGILRSIALVISGFGITLTLLTLVLERRRELGVVRSLGATRPQIQFLICMEALCIGAVATVLGTACGFVLAATLNYVINVAFFHWTIQWSTPWELVLQTPFWVAAACILAAWLPAYRASRAEISDALRTE